MGGGAQLSGYADVIYPTRLAKTMRHPHGVVDGPETVSLNEYQDTNV